MASKEAQIGAGDFDTYCGLGLFRPGCLQPFASLKAFLGLYSALSLITWSFYTVYVSSISNIEKAFGLSSTESGVLLTVWEIGYICCSLFASYFAPRAHIPRVIGVVTMLYGFAGLVTILPHFVAFTDPNLFDVNSTTSSNNHHEDSLCINTTITDLSGTKDGNEDSTDGTGFSKRTVAYALLNIAMVLQGATKSPCYPYSAQYVDDNCKKQNTGFYTGIISSIAIFGLAIGYGIGSLVSNLYVTLEDVSISPSDPRFISAWWLGMTVVSLLSFFIAFPMLCLPKRIKNKHTIARGLSNKDKGKSNVHGELKEAIKTLLEIVKSPVYVTILIASGFQVLATASFFGFEPKYIETQFQLPAWTVNIILGSAGIFSFSLGSLLGGYITKRYKFTPFTIIAFIISMAATCAVFVVVLMFVGCSQPDIVKQVEEPAYNLYQSTCNCTDGQFLPICGSDDRTWFSPCHAGCTVGTVKEFSNCSSIPGGEATVGLCPTGCTMLWLYVTLKFLHNVADAVASIPVFLVLLRSAGEERKSLGIGLSAAVLSCMSWLPGPSIGGKVVDSACLVWKKASSTSGEYCAFYDIEKQRYLMHGTMLGMRITSLILMTAGLFFARNLKSWEDNNTDNKLEKEQEENGVLVMAEQS